MVKVNFFLSKLNELTSNDMIAGNGRYMFMIKLIFEPSYPPSRASQCGGVVSIGVFWFYFVSFSYNGVCFLRFIFYCMLAQYQVSFPKDVSLTERTSKMIVPPKEFYLSVSIGTFLTNYDLTYRKL